MSTTTVKHQEFIGEPMGEKDVSAVAGIGPKYAEKLIDAGYDKAYVLFGQYLLLKKDKENFCMWLKDIAGMNEHHASRTYNCFREWADQYI